MRIYKLPCRICNTNWKGTDLNAVIAAALACGKLGIPSFLYAVGKSFEAPIDERVSLIDRLMIWDISIRGIPLTQPEQKKWIIVKRFVSYRISTDDPQRKSAHVAFYIIKSGDSLVEISQKDLNKAIKAKIKTKSM